MATKTLAQKLYIRPGFTVALLNAPKGAAELLNPLPDEVKIVTNLKEKPDLVLQFVKTNAELEKAAKELDATLTSDPILWFAYPKQASKTASDLTRDAGWRVLYDLGYTGIASIAIDNTWSGLRFRRAIAKSDEEVITKQYEGERAAFLPLYQRIVTLVQRMGPDIELQPRQTYVAFSRGKQFALVKPTRDHIDLVLKLPKAPLTSRLIAAPGVGSGSMTHRVPITHAADLDSEVIGWLQDAYRATTK